MPSERVQRQIDRLLDEAEEASGRRDWAAVDELAQHVLTFDPENADALALLAAAQRGLARPEASTPPPAVAPASLTSRVPLPAAFASGRYRVERFLGEGGRKRVYLAHDTRLDRDVAVAVIKTEGLDAAGLARVRNEGQAMARLGDHPNIVTVFDVLEEAAPAPRISSDPGSRGLPASAATAPVIVSQYMAGGSVEDLLAKAEEHRLSTAVVLSIATQVCAALEHAHGLGIVHRDLKPGNVWLAALTPTLSQREREQGSLSQREGDNNPLSLGERVRVRGSPAERTAKLGDFGLAVALDRSRVTMQGMMLGTVAYMPPEQALGGESTPRADLYSLGCMLYEMVTGRPPFLGDDPTAVISQHINTPPVAPSWLTERCPPELEEVILRLLAKAPGDRPASAAEVRAALLKVDPEKRSASHSDSTENPLDRLARGVFVGRKAELEKLRRAFDEAFAGRGSLVMLVGEPGIGKTRTCQELETYARMRGATVLWGRTHETGGAPAYWPWLQAGNQYAAANDLAAIGPLLPPGAAAELSRIFTWLRNQPNFVEPPTIDDPESAQFQLFEAYAAFIRAMATQTPLLVTLDDLHWADKASLLLLQHMARELSRLRVLVVGNYRDTDLSRTHPLSEALAGLNRDPGFTRIVLRGLTQPEVASYIRATANVEPKPELARRIYEETEGNPFFLSEVVNLMAQEGTLTRESVSDIRIPDGVKEALGRRLDRLSEEANELLQFAAIVGREFTFDTLQLAAGRDQETVFRLMEAAARGRVIEETEQRGRYRFTHALMQETLLGELTSIRRTRLHSQVGEALERRWGAQLAGERAARLAPHFVEAAMVSGEHARKAVRYSKLAAEQAERQSAWDEAAKHYENCLVVIAQGDAPAPEEEAPLLLAMGIAFRNAFRVRDAWRSLMRARTSFRLRGDAVGLARATLACLEVRTSYERLIALGVEAIEALGDAEPHLEGLLSALVAEVAAALSGEEFERITKELLSRAEQLAGQHDFGDVRALALYGRSSASVAELNYREGSRLCREAISAGAGLSASLLSEMHLRAFVWAVIAGDLDEAEPLGRMALDYVRRGHHVLQEKSTLEWQAAIALAREEKGRFEELLEQLSPVSTPGIHWLLSSRAQVSGDFGAALRFLPDIALAGGAPGLVALGHTYAARLYFNSGDRVGAEEAYREYLQSSEAIQPGWCHPGGLDEALIAFGDEAALRRCYDILAPGGVAIRGATCLGPSGHQAGDIALRLGMVEEAERHYRDVLAWAERERCPVEAGRCLHGLADVAERRGDTKEALGYLDRAIALFQQYGARLYLDRALAAKVRLQGIGTGRRSIDAVAESVQSEHPDLGVDAAPDGSITIFVSDIEDSTGHNERLGDARWLEALREHNEIMRRHIRAHGGHEVKTIGDAFMVVFKDPAAALRCAVEIQRAFAHRAGEPPIKVRIGLHTGKALRDRDDFFGTNVTLAFRIEASGAGGQILVSDAVRAAVREGFRFDEGREVELKGLSGKQRVYEVWPAEAVDGGGDGGPA